MLLSTSSGAGCPHLHATSTSCAHKSIALSGPVCTNFGRTTMSNNMELRTCISVDPTKTAKLLEGFFIDYREVTHCSQCVQGAILALLHKNLEGHNIGILRWIYPVAHSRALKFLTYYRTPEELKILDCQVSTCRCDVNDPYFRDLHSFAETHWSGMNLCGLLEIVTYFLHNGIQPTSNNGFIHAVAVNTRKAAQEGFTTLPWPATPVDLAPWPEGIIDTILGFGYAIHIMKSPSSIGLLGAFMDLFMEPSLEPFLGSPTLPGDLIEAGYIPSIVLEKTKNTGLFLTQLKHVALVCRVFSTQGSGEQLVRLNHLAKEQSRQGDMLELCNHVVQTLESLESREVAPMRADFEQCYHMFSMLSFQLHYYLREPYNKETYPISILINSMDLSRREKSIAKKAFKAIALLSYSHCCLGPRCAASFELAGRRFQGCAGCHRVFYCSRKCQQRSWNDPGVPHKAICKAIKRVATATNLATKPATDTANKFERLCGEKGVSEEDLIKITTYWRVVNAQRTNAATEEVSKRVAFLNSPESSRSVVAKPRG